MQMLDHAAIDARMDWPALIAALRAAFARNAITAPPRQTLTIDLPDGQTASLLLMPAWEAGKAIGVKVVTFFPGNAAQGKATINAGYLLFDGADGRMQAVLDGDALTARRTAAATALAADYLARPDARVLLVAGTGQLSEAAALAHSAVRRYDRVLIWGRTTDKAQQIVARLKAQGLAAETCLDLEAGARGADVICTVTASTVPLIRGDWLRPGSHLDLIGAFKPDMRECDTQAIVQAEIFVDSRAGALLAGDLAQPLAAGAITDTDVLADLAELVQGRHPGRRDATARTVFKSAGMALEDLAAAMLAQDGSA